MVGICFGPVFFPPPSLGMKGQQHVDFKCVLWVCFSAPAKFLNCIGIFPPPGGKYKYIFLPCIYSIVYKHHWLSVASFSLQQFSCHPQLQHFHSCQRFWGIWLAVAVCRILHCPLNTPKKIYLKQLGTQFAYFCRYSELPRAHRFCVVGRKAEFLWLVWFVKLLLPLLVITWVHNLPVLDHILGPNVSHICPLFCIVHLWLLSIIYFWYLCFISSYDIVLLPCNSCKCWNI